MFSLVETVVTLFCQSKTKTLVPKDIKTLHESIATFRMTRGLIKIIGIIDAEVLALSYRVLDWQENDLRT